MNILVFIYLALLKITLKSREYVTNYITKILFALNKVAYGDELISKGVPFVRVRKDGRFTIGNRFRMNNGKYFNPIGRQQKCMFLVDGKLHIGDNVGMSSTAIVCQNYIYIGDYVKIGGNTIIYDTDFHSLDSHERCTIDEITTNIVTKPVIIKSKVFVGAHSIILKGVTIGENSIIGASSVVTKNIPANEIWGGNPAKFLKKNK